MTYAEKAFDDRCNRLWSELTMDTLFTSLVQWQFGARFPESPYWSVRLLRRISLTVPASLLAPGVPAACRVVVVALATVLSSAASGKSKAQTSVAGAGRTYAVGPGQSIQSAFTAAEKDGGGTVYVGKGVYPQATTLFVSSRTHLVCERGAAITAVDAGWTGYTLFGAKLLIVNRSLSPPAVGQGFDDRARDHDIEISGCELDTEKDFHQILFYQVDHVRIHDNWFRNNGDATAMLNTRDSVIERNFATNSNNACYDHWSGTTHFVVRNNYCRTTVHGILATGIDTSGTRGLTTSDGEIDGNTIVVTGIGVGIWLQGGGSRSHLVAAGAARIEVTNNKVLSSGHGLPECWRISGQSTDNVIARNTCAAPGATMADVAADSTGNEDYGTPSNNKLTGNFYDSPQEADRNGAIHITAPRTRVENERIIGGKYPYGIWVAGDGDQLLNNWIDTGTTGKVNTSGATKLIVIVPRSNDASP